MLRVMAIRRRWFVALWRSASELGGAAANVVVSFATAPAAVAEFNPLVQSKSVREWSAPASVTVPLDAGVRILTVQAEATSHRPARRSGSGAIKGHDITRGVNSPPPRSATPTRYLQTCSAATSHQMVPAALAHRRIDEMLSHAARPNLRLSGETTAPISLTVHRHPWLHRVGDPKPELAPSESRKRLTISLFNILQGVQGTRKYAPHR
jgi:hypothetical protein